MNGRRPRPRPALPRLWWFALEHLLLLPLGAAIALVWANAAPDSYFRVTFAIAFAVNDVAMVFFFALITKEVVEATAPGGVLHPWRRALLPIIVALAATAASAAIHVRVVEALEEPALKVVWPVVFGTDLALSYLVARVIFGRHPVIPFVLLTALACDAFGFVAIAWFEPASDRHLTQGAVIMAIAVAIAAMLRRRRVMNFWVYLATAGVVSWFALFRSGLHPALALVPIIPFLPHVARDPGFFVDAAPDAKDPLSRFEIWWRYPAQVALFFFGLVNAGVSLSALEPGTWGLPIAVLVGRPLGIVAGAVVGVTVGLHLPHRVRLRDLIVVGFIVGISFSVGLFFCAALLPSGQLRHETSMGVLLTLAGIPLAFLSARLLRVGRFG
jgi:NhaA family Na+:H+ antiporter